MIRVKVYGPNVGQFGCDVYEIQSPADVFESPEGATIIKTGPIPERPHPHNPERTLPALRARTVVYPRGEATKVIIEDVVDNG